MKTTETKTAATKPATKPVTKTAAKSAKVPKAAKTAPAAAMTLIVEEFRKEVGKTVSLIAQRVANRKDCWSFQYKNSPFVVFAKPGSETPAVQKVVQAFNVAK